jgi:hypothetical protein
MSNTTELLKTAQIFVSEISENQLKGELDKMIRETSGVKQFKNQLANYLAANPDKFALALDRRIDASK